MKAINRAIEKYEKLILEAERRIWSTPETGFREVKSCAYLAERFRELGYSLTMAGDIPGFYTVVDTGREGPEVLVLGELASSSFSSSGRSSMTADTTLCSVISSTLM